MNFLDFVNQVLRETGVSTGVSTLSGVDEESDVGKTIVHCRSACRDISRKMPQAALKRTGSINTAARVLLSDYFSDMDADGEPNNALTISGKYVSGASDNALQVSESWLGRLFNVKSFSYTYRVRSVDLSNKRFTLGDFGGNEIAWQESDASVDSLGNAIDQSDAWSASSQYAIGEIAQDRYLLPVDFKAPDGLSSFWGPNTLELLSAEDFDRKRFAGSFYLVGAPEISTIREVTVSGGRLRHFVELYPIPEVAMMLPFRYEASFTIPENDNDVVQVTEELLQALFSRARWYVFRFVRQSETDVQIEEATWRDALNDNAKNPVSSREHPRMIPETNREFRYGAYDG